MNDLNKNIMKIYSTMLVLIVGLTFSLQAQEDEVEADEKPTFSLAGSVDAYYRANLNSTNIAVDLGDGTPSFVAPGTSFANQPGFALGMANLIGSYEGEKVGFVADLVFGPRGTDAVSASTTSSSSVVNQLYVYLNVSESVTFTLGNFNTFLGYEVISPTGNFNYSTSYMFSYGPFSHSGLKVDVALGNSFSVMGGIFNPTDFTDFNPIAEYVGGVQIGYEGDNGGVWLNSLFDNEFYQIDLTTGFDISDNVYLGFNGTVADKSFYGLAGYVQLATSDALKFGLRGELFGDEGLGLIGDGETVFDLTLSANYTVGNLTIIPEFRADFGSEDFFVDKDLAPQSSLSSFVLAGIYTF